MSTYNPDTWVILRIDNGDDPVYFKVLAGWSGGYLDGDSWKLNSGITKVELIDDYYHFHGWSGSVYKCHKNGQQMRMSIAGTYSQLKEKFGDRIQLVDVEDIKIENPA